MKIKAKNFYYKFDRLNFWLLFNIAFFNMLAYCCFSCPCLLFWPQTQILIGVFIFSCLAWCFKYVKKHRMAFIDNESITIDHCKPLFWKDVQNAEERIVRCCFKKRKIIVLNIKDGTDYQYNFLQKHNGEFTPFSIPLYGILSKEDEEEITKLIARKVPLKKLSN